MPFSLVHYSSEAASGALGKLQVYFQSPNPDERYSYEGNIPQKQSAQTGKTAFIQSVTYTVLIDLETTFKMWIQS